MSVNNNFNVNKIRGLMAEKNETMSDLAILLKVHKNTISKKINRKREFTVTELKKIADHYGVEVQIFFN